MFIILWYYILKRGDGMYRFFDRLRMFFYGRNGVDTLGKFLLAVYLIVAIVNAFMQNLSARYSLIIVQWIILAIILFRMLSRNIAARQRENQAFERIFLKFKPAFSLLRNRIKHIRTKRYRTCPNCKVVSRLPIKRGKHFVKCPKCNIPFKVYIII